MPRRSANSTMFGMSCQSRQMFLILYLLIIICRITCHTFAVSSTIIINNINNLLIHSVRFQFISADSYSFSEQYSHFGLRQIERFYYSHPNLKTNKQNSSLRESPLIFAGHSRICESNGRGTEPQYNHSIIACRTSGKAKRKCT